MKFDWKILWEAAKEPLRLLVLAIIPSLLVYFQGLNVEWAAIIVLVLRFIDKVLHEYGKETDKKEYVTGLTRF